MSLTEYRAKRDFRTSREPAGRRGVPENSRHRRYVIQKHSASHLHYDFRLEIAGVLKSWAVPKGIPTRRGDRRLAIEVEDHPLEYGNFEGTIPPGNYGAGTVMVWDLGTYTVSGEDPTRALESGKIHLRLKGKKLDGEWTLVRLRNSIDSSKPQWLLLKSGRDTHSNARVEDESALTGRSLAQIAHSNDRHWTSNRREPQRPKTARSKSVGSTARKSLSLEPDLPRKPPGFVAPMKALLVRQLPKGPQWVYEIKFDGIRALAIKHGGDVNLVSRTNKDLGYKYPIVVNAVKGLSVGDAVLDGEIVAIDSKGRPAFQLLQSYEGAGAGKPPLLYYIFDILNLEGRDLTRLPLWKRKDLTEEVAKGRGPVIRYSAGIRAKPERVMGEMQRRGLEGLLAKIKDSRYEPGLRSGAWVKFKWTLEQEFVIGGFTEPKGGRSNFGAILVGYYDGRRLLFAGKVGTGFDHRALGSLSRKFESLVRAQCPFDLPERQGLTRAQMRHCTWLDPELVCQVRFSEWTREGRLRQPAFLGLREDKDPREVARETAG